MIDLKGERIAGRGQRAVDFARYETRSYAEREMQKAHDIWSESIGKRYAGGAVHIHDI